MQVVVAVSGVVRWCFRHSDKMRKTDKTLPVVYAPLDRSANPWLRPMTQARLSPGETRINHGFCYDTIGMRRLRLAVTLHATG